MRYSPLNANQNEIRLITILPPDAHPSDPDRIHCTLENVSMDNFTSEYQEFIKGVGSDLRRNVLLGRWIRHRQQAIGLEDSVGISAVAIGRYDWGDYVALSYTWGELAITDTIILNGQPFSVTKNLHAALLQLCTQKIFIEGTKLWVDAICINQGDLQERNLQVQRMRQIYSSAISTSVWLGVESDDSTLAIELISVFAKAGKNMEIIKPTAEKPLQSEEAKFWMAIYRFLNRSYWKRVWILQEIIVSHSTLNIICGNKQLFFEDLNLASSTIIDNYLAAKESIRHAYRAAGLPEPPLSVKVLLERIKSLSLPFIDMIKHNDRRFLSILLKLSQSSEQTNPKDKLYALLGLLDKQITDLITPDYSLPTWKVFASFGKAVIKATSRLEILRRCDFEDEEERTVPSWVPNLMSYIKTNDWDDRVTFEAGGSILPVADFMEDDRALLVMGFRIDTVDGIGGTFWDYVGSSPSIVHPTSEANAYGEERAIRRALWRTLVAAGKELDGTNTPDKWEAILHIPSTPPTWYNDELREYLQAIHVFLDLNSGMRICGRGLREWIFLEAENPQDSSRASEISGLYSRMLEVQSFRRLMSTLNGYIGIAPKPTQQGDIICILFGCSTPMVIRPIKGFENCFSIVGECYVSGLMEGETMNWVLEEKARLETFVLC